MYDYDFEEFYEPSQTNIIIMEAKEKLEECIKQEVKQEIEAIKSENERLKLQVKEYKDKEYELRNREFDILLKEKDLERDFLRSKFSELVKPFIEKQLIYVIDKSSKLIQKCEKCNEERMIEYTSIYGDVVLQKCSCKEYKTHYRPILKEISTINFYKDYSKIRLTPRFEGDRYDSEYFKIDIQNGEIEEFKEDIADNIELYKDYFLSKEVCQQYCDYLNKEKGW